MVDVLQYRLYIDAVRTMAQEVSASSSNMMSGVVLLLVSWRLIASMLPIRSEPPVVSVVFSVVASSMLRHYVDGFDWIVEQFTTFYNALFEATSIRDYFSRIPDSGSQSTIEWVRDVFSRYAAGTMIALPVYMFAWVSTQLVGVLGGILLAILFVFGPMYIMAMPATDGKSLGMFLRSIFEIGCWKLFGLFCMIIVTHVQSSGLSGFVGVLILDITVGIAALLSPLFVRMLLNGAIANIGTTLSAILGYVLGQSAISAGGSAAHRMSSSMGNAARYGKNAAHNMFSIPQFPVMSFTPPPSTQKRPPQQMNLPSFDSGGSNSSPPPKSGHQISLPGFGKGGSYG